MGVRYSHPVPERELEWRTSELMPRPKRSEITVTRESNTSITLTSSEEDCKLSDCLKKAQELSRPGIRELILEGKNFVPIEPKDKTTEFLRIRAKRGNFEHMLHSVAQQCSALTELELTFGETYRIDPPHVIPTVCQSLRVLELSARQLTLKDLIPALEAIAVVYPNIQRLSISLTGRFRSEDLSPIEGARLQLHHLDVLQFSSKGTDPEAERHLQQTVYAFCPQLAKTKSQDGASSFRRIHGVTGYVDHLGGELSIPAHDVKLSIPPGALEDREKISIEVFSELPNGINLQGNEMVASYGFRCFPSGLTFKKPLTLSMPHCAIIDNHESLRMVLHFGNDTSVEIKRIPLMINEYVINSDRIELQLRHFSWGILTMIYWLFPGIKPESQATKRMLCAPFIPSTLPGDQHRPVLRLWIYSQLPGLPEKIIEEEESMNYKKVYPGQEFIVKENSPDMTISFESEELPSAHKEEVSTKNLMQLSKLAVDITLPKRRSEIKLIIEQERKITMKFWTDIKESPSFVGEVDGTIVPVQSMSLAETSTGTVQTGATASTMYTVTYPRPELRPRSELNESQKLVPLPPGQLAGFHCLRRFSNRECLTDEQLEDLSRSLPIDKFTAISVKLGFNTTETENINSSSHNAQRAYFTMLTRWQEKTGAPKAQLVEVLKNVKLLGLVQSCFETDNDPEDIDSS